MSSPTRVSAGTIFRSASFVGIGSVWRNLSRALLAPVILGYVGVEGYGVWTLLFSIVASVNFMDVSFGFAYAKFSAECDARQSYQELSELLGAGVRIVGGVALVMLSVLYFYRYPALRALSVPEPMLDEAAIALLFIMGTVMMQLSVGNISQILNGLQRGDLRAKGQMIASSLYFALGIALLAQGWGLVGLAAAYAFGQLFAVAIGWRWAKRICPELRIAWIHVPRDATRRVLALGGRYQLIHAANLLSGPGFKMLISALLGPAELAMYEIARKLVSLGQTAMQSVISPLMPAFANLLAQSRHARIHDLIHTGSRLIGALSWVSFGLLWVFADPTIALWMGEHYPTATWTMRILMVGVAFQLLTGIGTSNLRAHGAVRLEIIWNMGSAAILLLTVWPLFRLYGYEGLVIARVAGLIIAASWFLVAFAKVSNIKLRTMATDALARPTLVFLPIVVAFSYLYANIGNLVELKGRWDLALHLSVWGGSMGVSFMVVAWLALITNEEKKWLAKMVRKRINRQAP